MIELKWASILIWIISSNERIKTWVNLLLIELKRDLVVFYRSFLFTSLMDINNSYFYCLSLSNIFKSVDSVWFISEITLFYLHYWISFEEFSILFLNSFLFFLLHSESLCRSYFLWLLYFRNAKKFRFSYILLKLWSVLLINR